MHTLKYSTSPAWTFASRYKTQKSQKAPGPGEYEPERSQNDGAPTWKIGTSHRPDLAYIDRNVPGPGSYRISQCSYNPNRKYHIISGSKFHTQTKHDKLNTTTPGPGQYSPKHNVSKKSYGGYYMARRNKARDYAAEIPGPGSYQEPRISLNRSGVVIGHQKRLIEYQSQVPGPGTYQLNSRPFSASSGPKAVFTTEDRMKRSGEDINPLGPGQYNYKSTFPTKQDHRGYSIAGKPEPRPSEKAPGPGAYTPSYIDKPSNPGITMGQRTETLSTKPKDTPGPGQYLKTGQVSHNSKYGTIGTEQRKPLLENTETPGPAAYSINTVPEGPKYSLHKAKDLKSNQKIPGPGQYNPNVEYVKTRPASAKIGNSKRNETKLTVAPGPGAYSHFNEFDGPRWGFGSSIRSKQNSKSIPGPGQYEIPTTIAQVAPYSMSKSQSSNFVHK